MSPSMTLPVCKNLRESPFKNNGFSLIELIVVIALVGILTSLAFPSYTDYIVRARRYDAQTALLDLATRLEQYYAENHTYYTATLGTQKATDILSSPITSSGWYTLNINATDTTYIISATPLKAQATQDILCQTLTLNNLGVKGITAGPQGLPTGSLAQCSK